LVPTGKLRLAVVQHPGFLAHGSPPAGLGVDLGGAVASRLGVPLVTTTYPDPGSVLAAAQTPGWDIALIPVTPSTSAAVNFAAQVLLVPHALLVRRGLTASTMAETDQPGVKIAVMAGSGDQNALAAVVKHAKIVPVASDDAAMAMLSAGQVDAIVAPRFDLAQETTQVPGSHPLTDDFFVPAIGIAVTKGHSSALAYLSELVEQLKASGVVKATIDKAGLTGIEVASAGSAPK
jgi:polar amino acid transport system substrate-binding protein